jgi:hypothetical protein
LKEIERERAKLESSLNKIKRLLWKTKI